MSMDHSFRRLGFATTLVSACALALASTAGAATLRTGYEPGGWGATTLHSGICLQTLICPSVTNTVVKGPPGTYEHTELGSLTGVAARTDVTWTSAPFTYNGAQGKRSKNVTFVMRRRSNTTNLLSVTGNTATYSANLISAKTGNTVAEAVRNANLRPTTKFTRVGPKRLVGAVRRGRTYRIEVVFTFLNGVAVVPFATSDFRRARIVARRHVSRHHRHH